jgi:hypothetical protein
MVAGEFLGSLLPQKPKRPFPVAGAIEIAETLSLLPLVRGRCCERDTVKLSITTTDITPRDGKALDVDLFC